MKVLSQQEAMDKVAEQLGFVSNPIQDPFTFFSHIMRRACSIYCPVPRYKLLQIVVNLLSGLVEDDKEKLKAKIADALEGLFASGDLLEISRFRSFDDQYSGDWIFTSQPSFYLRNDKRLYVSGIPKGDVTFLPVSLQSELKSVGPYRFIPACNDQDIESLLALGIRQLSENDWNPQPKSQTAEEFINSMKNKVDAAPAPGLIANVLVLGDKRPNYQTYKLRWENAVAQTGYYVCRRPKGYGAHGWIFAKLDKGIVQKFVDLPLSNDSQRGCDAGWHIQLAKDTLNGTPDTYSMVQSSDSVNVKFNFPLPLWAQRRLRLVDDHLNHSTFERSFTNTQWSIEKAFLETNLWLTLQN